VTSDELCFDQVQIFVFLVRANQQDLTLETDVLAMEWRTGLQGSRMSSLLDVMESGSRLESMTSVHVMEDLTSSLFSVDHFMEL